MNYKSANTHSARNAGLVAVGFMVTLIGFSVIGNYAFAFAPIVGIATYFNDKVQDNDPSMFDPLYTLAGGLLVALFMCIRGAYGH